MQLVHLVAAAVAVLATSFEEASAATLVHAVVRGNELLRVCTSIPDDREAFDGCGT